MSARSEVLGRWQMDAV